MKSIEQNARYKNVVVYAENCDDGTDEFLVQHCLTHPDVSFFIEKNNVPVGIGGGMNKAATKVDTEYINFLHSDMWVTKDFDVPLLKIVSENPKTIASSWRIEPDIFGGMDRLGTTVAPIEAFGHLHSNFKPEEFDKWAAEFVKQNLIRFRKVEGVSFMIRKTDWNLVGGNDDRFRPSSYDDIDLFSRMDCMGFNFTETSESVVFHFGARGSIFRGDDFTKRHPRQIKAESDNCVKWVNKWGEPPTYDPNGFIIVTKSMRDKFQKIYPNN